MRFSINGRKYSKSTRTTDRGVAERILEKTLASYGLGSCRVALHDVWEEYLKSPCRNDQAKATLESKRSVWLTFAHWMEDNYPLCRSLAEVTRDAIAEYLSCLRAKVSAGTYNSRLCVLREMFHVLKGKAGLEEDVWEGVKQRPDDSISRRELTVSELKELFNAAIRAGDVWRKLFTVGIYTGLRLGDCCRLSWDMINVEKNIIQIVPSKTKRHTHGKVVTIPIHPVLKSALIETPEEDRKGFVNPEVGELYVTRKHIVHGRIAKIFKDAGILMSRCVEGRRNAVPDATFHSLRHTFVSLAANAGVPLHIVQSIVGHESTAMTRHYYHENVSALNQAVVSIPNLFDNSQDVTIQTESETDKLKRENEELKNRLLAIEMRLNLNETQKSPISNNN